MTVIAESNGHHWIKWRQFTCCRDCGIIRRADDKCGLGQWTKMQEAAWSRVWRKRMGDYETRTYQRDGAEVQSTHIPGGYSGSTDYVITGPFDAVTKVVEGICGAYHPSGYGTWFHWPPGKKTYDGKPLEYKKPIEIEPGKWRAFGSHSNSCD